MTVEQDHDPDGEENEFDDEIEDQEVEHRTPLQAAIAWIMARNSELAFALAETDLATIDAIIRRANLTPLMSQEKAWAELQAAVSGGHVSMWGHEFELPADYEHGDVWPSGSLRQLASNDISNMCLFDVRGMEAGADGHHRHPDASSQRSVATARARRSDRPAGAPVRIDAEGHPVR